MEISTPTRWRRYVALGDSITEGLADEARDGYRGWADRLADALADRSSPEPFEYANLAIRGRLLPQILSEQVPAARELQPDLVSIWGGGNDMLRPGADPDAMAASLEDAVVGFREAGADVLIGLGVDCLGSPVLELTRPRTAVYNAHIWSLARRHGALVIDTWGLRSLKDWRMWAEDRIHLNAAGHARVAQAALVGLGLDPDDPDFALPLEPRPPMSRREAASWNYVWARDHLRPWLMRRVRRTSSGHGRDPKLPQPVRWSPPDA